LGEIGAREEEPDARARHGAFIWRQGCLVTTPIAGSSPAREEAGHGVEVASIRGGRDEDDLLLLFFCRRGKLAGLGCYSGRGAGLPRWADAGLRGQVSLLLPFLLFLISFFLFSILLI
jgi:hypothetical protein